MSRKAKTETTQKTPEERERERRVRFVKHAERRVSRVLKALKAVGNLANQASYSYTDAEAEKILGAITSATADMVALWSGKEKLPTGFILFG